MSGFTYEIPFRRLKETLNNQCGIITKNTSSLSAQNYITSMNQILSTIDQGIDSFKVKYHIQPNTNDNFYIERKRDQLSKKKLKRLLSEMRRGSHAIPDYQEVYEIIVLRIKLI